MKIIQRLLVILVIAVCTFSIMPQNLVMAATNVGNIVGGVTNQVKEPSDSGFTADLQKTIGKLLGFLQIASGLISIIVIAGLGFNYIISTPDVKSELSKKAVPIIVGLILVFSAVSITKFMLGVVDTSKNASTEDALYKYAQEQTGGK